MTTRFDVSTVPPQGGYIAKQCPVRIQNDVLRPSEPLDIVSADVLMRMADGIAFEASVFDELRLVAKPRWVFIAEDLERDAAVSATVAAMEAGADLIAGGWLPLDEAGRRTGKPDLLIRDGDGYVPVDVKHHLTLEVADDVATPVSSLSSPSAEIVETREGWGRRKNRGDLLQLAHYRRMLEACGHASSSMAAGIIGKERVIVWHDLYQPIWQTPAKSDGKKRKLRTTMEIYDFEFGFRLDIAAVAQRSLALSEVPLLVEPVWSGECPDCPCLDYCSLTLMAGSGDPSLLPQVGYEEWRVLRDYGITDRAGVARLSYRTARLLTSHADLEGENLDPATAAFGSVAFLPNAILNARAVTGELPVYRLPDKTGADVARADIELDIDMESTNDGVYLWGVLITDRSNIGLAQPGYLPFVTFEPIDSLGELDVFRSFWGWLTDLMAKAAAAGVSVNAYCWYSSAENTQMRRIAAVDPEWAKEVAEFIASPQWIDMEQVFRESWITGGSRSLKAIAPLAGHTWPVDDPGGGLSMVKHVEATWAIEGLARDAARQWLLDYNRGDVEATVTIREWLDREGSIWPELEDQ
ncbi:MAG: hypothetical protein ACRDWA_13085 [Acidimicrobiia bacterium]